MFASRETNRIVHLVRLLVAITITAGGGVAVYFESTLFDRNQQHAQMIVQENVLTNLTDAINYSLEESYQIVANLLVLKSGLSTEDTASGMKSTRRDIKKLSENELLTDKGKTILARIDITVSASMKLRTEAHEWYKRIQKISDDVTSKRKLKQLRNILVQEIAAIDGSLEQQRIQQAVLLQKYSEAAGAESDLLIKQMVKNQMSLTKGTRTKIKEELIDIARLIEILASENQLDNLIDLKDNQLKSSLDRLARNIDVFKYEVTHTQGVNQDVIKSLWLFLFGDGYKVDAVHQIINVGSGGLYALTRDNLIRHQTSRKLQEELQLLSVQFHQQYNALIFDIEDQLRILEEQQEERLDIAWVRMIVLSALAGVIFLIVAYIVFRMLAKQSLVQYEMSLNLGRISNMK